MIEIDWKKDYNNEFVCPLCNKIGMQFLRKTYRHNIKGARFICPHCNQTCKAPLLTNIHPVADPTNKEVVWYTNHKIRDFICPSCQARNIYFDSINKEIGKKRFKCRSCRKRYNESINLSFQNISAVSGKTPRPISFDFSSDRWDLRSVNPNFDALDITISNIDFSSISLDWFKSAVKKYILHLCKSESSFSRITSHLSSLRFFGRYLEKVHITGFKDINRSLMINYVIGEKKNIKTKISALRTFFLVGTEKAWFEISRDIIRDEDYPKKRQGNPEPLSDIVREKIEQNLHKLPNPVARMWIICFFSAMRPSELALLKQDCLVQEGEHWKLVWQRKKSNDYHEVPISRTIAKVIQEQLSYIQNLWGREWDYLFCHYHKVVSTGSSQPNLKPVKKVIPNNSNNPLLTGIRTLIKDLKICDENGQPVKFKTKLLRPTRLTQLFEQGHDLAVVSAWAGHKHFATTSTYYTKVSCDLIEQEAGHIQKALVNNEGHPVAYESFPKSFWETPQAHKLELSETHINTPIYGYCGLDLDQDCHKFRACYTCPCFVATPEKLPQYIKTRDELRGKQSKALVAGQDVLVEQFSTQADQLDKIIASLQEAA